MSPIAKFWVALASALAVAVSVTADQSLSMNDVITILSAAVGTIAVYYVPNSPREH